MKDLDENYFPDWEKRYPGIERGAVGQAEGEARFIREVMGLYLVAFFVMYAMLAVAFHSYWQPILILIQYWVMTVQEMIMRIVQILTPQYRQTCGWKKTVTSQQEIHPAQYSTSVRYIIMRAVLSFLMM